LKERHINVELLALAQTLISVIKTGRTGDWLTNTLAFYHKTFNSKDPSSTSFNPSDNFQNINDPFTEINKNYSGHAQKLSAKLKAQDRTLLSEPEPLSIRTDEEFEEEISGRPAAIKHTILEELEELIDSRGCAQIPVTDQFQIFADSEGGAIIGPIGEGSTAVVFFARRRSQPVRGGAQVGFALRLPKLSTGTILHNFENAETCYFEHIQAGSTPQHDSLGTPLDYGCLHRVIHFDNADEFYIADEKWMAEKKSNELFVGINMISGAPSRIGVLTRSAIWPAGLRNALHRLGSTPSAIFDKMGSLLEKSRERHKENMNLAVTSGELIMPPIFLFRDDRSHSGTIASTNVGKIGKNTCDGPGTPIGGAISIDRQLIEDTYSRERTSGWAFGLPFMVTDWLATDLHRLLSGLVNSARPGETDKQDASQPLLDQAKTLTLQEWLELCARLCEGLSAIHGVASGDRIDRVHGDVRPANIMFMRGVRPKQCKWIDVGLGSLAARERRLEQTRRTSVFYAWERTEHASEENDQVEFVEDINGNEPRYKLRFLFRDDNLKAARPVNLKGGLSGAGGKLSLLRPGDRLVIGGEFVFQVKTLEDQYVEVSKAWEIAAGQVPIERSLKDIFGRSEHKTISEFKILWQWGLASDIYGFGMILLFIFYMRGLYGFISHGYVKADETKGSALDVEEGFANLVSAVRTDGFLSAFLRSLDVSPTAKSDGQKMHFREKAMLLELDAKFMHHVRTKKDQDDPKQEPTIQKLNEIYDELRVFAPGLEYVFYGVNSNPAVFTLLLYIILSALWRDDEVNRLGKNVPRGEREDEVKFTPYCKSRSSVPSDDLAAASKAILGDLRIISRHMGAQPHLNLLYNSANPVVEAGATHGQTTGDIYIQHRNLKQENNALLDEKKALEAEKVAFLSSGHQVITRLDELIDEMSRKTAVRDVLFKPSNYIAREPMMSRLRSVITDAKLNFGKSKSD
jgi:hypothetical protein